MERLISQKILRSYFHKLERRADLEAAIVGAGPSGLLCAHDLAKAGKHVAIFERMLKPGGGMWGGGMLFNEIVVQTEVLPIVAELGVNHSPVEQGMASADAVELAAALIYHTVHAGAVIFNGIAVEDLPFKEDRVGGVVINWSPVQDQGPQVDPLILEELG